jgi:guanylate kinase
MCNIIILSGPCSSGKDVIARLLEKEGFNFVISTTTRPIRENEINKKLYNFTNNDNFEKLIKRCKLIEYRKYITNNNETWYYGTQHKEIKKDKNYVAILDSVGLYRFKQHFKDVVISFYMDASEDVRKERCKRRGDYNEIEWLNRLKNDNEIFSKEFIENEIDYVINAEDNPNEILNEIIKKIN